MDTPLFVFVLKIAKEQSFLLLKHGDRETDRLDLGDAFGLAEHILPALDRLMQKHEIAPEKVEGFFVESDLPEGYSAKRIAETVANVYVFAVLERKS